MALLSTSRWREDPRSLARPPSKIMPSSVLTHVPSSAELCSVAELLQTAAELFANEQYESSAALLRYVLAFRRRSPELWGWLAAILDTQGESTQADLVRQVLGK